ncbi:MAG: hypothetical protein WBB76_12110 [Gaiellaceae bacterium]
MPKLPAAQTVAIALVALAGLIAVSTAPARSSGTSSNRSSVTPVVVNLGAHRFGHTRSPVIVVARASAAQVGWQLEGDNSGPETFLVGRDRSIWLHDEVNHRLLVWSPGRPNAVARTVTLPFLNAEDVAFGPANTLYFDRGVPELKEFHLYRLSLAGGKVLWNSKLGGGTGGNTSLRPGPDGTLYALVPHMRWMPVATSAGRPLSLAAQQRGTGYQPLPGGLRLVPRVVSAHDVRITLLGRRGNVVRTWRIVSSTAINFTGFYTPELVGGDPVVVLDATAGTPGRDWKWEYEVLRLTPHAASARFSLRRAVFGDNLFADLRIGPDGALYQLASSPKTGVAINRYSVGG